MSFAHLNNTRFLIFNIYFKISSLFKTCPRWSSNLRKGFEGYRGQSFHLKGLFIRSSAHKRIALFSFFSRIGLTLQRARRGKRFLFNKKKFKLKIVFLSLLFFIIYSFFSKKLNKNFLQKIIMLLYIFFYVSIYLIAGQWVLFSYPFLVARSSRFFLQLSCGKATEELGKSC